MLQKSAVNSTKNCNPQQVKGADILDHPRMGMLTLACAIQYASYHNDYKIPGADATAGWTDEDSSAVTVSCVLPVSMVSVVSSSAEVVVSGSSSGNKEGKVELPRLHTEAGRL